jgi:hypothetical protein
MGFTPIPAVTEPPKSLGPPTVVLVQRTSDNPIDAPDHSTSSVSVSFTFPKSVSPVTQILQHIGGIYRRGRGADARGGATTRGARAAAASPHSAGQASDRTRGSLLLPSSSAHRLKIFAYLGMITAQDLLPR